MTTRKPREPETVPEAAPYRLPFHAAAPRRASGSVRVLPDFPGVVLPEPVAGVIYPQSPDEVRLADALGLPVITTTQED